MEVSTIERVEDRDAEGWSAVQDQLRRGSSDDFEAWFARLRFGERRGGTIVLTAPTLFIARLIRDRFADKILRFWRDVDSSVDALVVENRRLAPMVTKAQDSEPEIRRTEPAEPAWTKAETGTSIDTGGLEFFQRDEGNEIAVAVVGKIIGSGKPIEYNPLVIFGTTGNGKTHLAEAVDTALNQSGAGRCVLLTSREFMTSLAPAMGSGRQVPEGAFDMAVAVVIEDVQNVCGRVAVAAFARLVDWLMEAGKQIIVTSDRMPCELDLLSDRTRSILSSGLVVGIDPPKFETREAIARDRAAAADVEIPDDVIAMIASKVKGNGRDVRSAVDRLVAFHRITADPISTKMCEKSLRDLFMSNDSTRLKIEDVQKAICDLYCISRIELISARRTHDVVKPRQVAMYLCKMLTPRSLPEIGRRFGNRDHTTVLHAVRKIGGLVQSDRDLRETVEVLARQLGVDGQMIEAVVRGAR